MRRLVAVLLLLAAAQVRAATEYPPSLHWYTLTTEHFFIHYHQGEEELAQRAAIDAEQVHARLVPMIGWEPSGRTNIVLTDHVDESNGSATPFPVNRVEIYVTAPGADPSSPIGNYDDWLNLVITHEYTHILHLDQARGFGQWMRRIFGRNPLLSFPNEFTPLWFIEGLATLSETENTTAGRLKGTYLDMILRTAAIEDRWSTEAQASGLGPQWPDGNTRYYYGAKFLSWLASTRGMDKLTAFINDYSANVVPFRINASAEAVYGVDMKTLWEQWSDEQQHTYRVQRDALGPITPHTRLTRLGYETKNSILSPNGTRVAYAHQGPFERPTIRVRDLASNRDVATHSVNSTSPLSWSPDGRSIAYSDIEFVNSFWLLSDLYIWSPDGGTRRVTHGARLRDPAFAPDGRSLIAVENGEGRNQLVEVDVATGAIRKLVSTDAQFDEPAVSHDGKFIAVAEWQNGTVNIALYTRDGQRMKNLTPSFTRALNASPRFSPDDRTIWFSSDVTGVTNLYAVSADGGEPRRISNVYGGAFYPSSTDGRHFVYGDYSADGFDLATMDAINEYPAVARVIPATVIAASRTQALEQPRPEARGPRPYSPWQSLRPRWWFPIISSTSVNGKDKPIAGITTSGADVLGRHSYTATLTNRLYGVVYSYDRFYPTFTVAASQFDDSFTSSSSNEFTVVTDRVAALMTIPWQHVQWQTYGTVGLIRDHIGGDIPGGVFRGTLQGIRAGILFNNAHEYSYSISPEHGVTASVDYEKLSESMGSDASLQTLRGDLRTYITIPWSSSPVGRHVLALRAAGGRNTGEFVLQRELRVGGDSTGELTTLDITNFPVRGFDEGTLRGQSAAIGSVEYRFPIYEIDRGPSTYPFFFNRIHGDVFSDGGRASGRHIASAGAEVSADFFVANALFIRLRTGVAARLTEPDRGNVVPYISIGSSF